MERLSSLVREVLKALLTIKPGEVLIIQAKTRFSTAFLNELLAMRNTFNPLSPQKLWAHRISGATCQGLKSRRFFRTQVLALRLFLIVESGDSCNHASSKASKLV